MQFGYRMSKAALNMAGATMAVELKPSQVHKLSMALFVELMCYGIHLMQPQWRSAWQVTVSLIHPGVVVTNMLRTLRVGRGVAADKLQDNTITPAQSADGIWKVICNTKLTRLGSFGLPTLVLTLIGEIRHLIATQWHTA